MASAEETDEPEPRSDPEHEGLEPSYYTDLQDPPDSGDHMVEVAEPDPAVDPDPPPVEEAVAEAQAAPAYVPTAADEALLARSIDFFDKFVAAIESNAGNCDRMADALSEVISGSRDLIAEGKAMADDPGRNQWFAGQMETKAAAGVERMMAPLQSCVSNERMMAVLTSLTE